MKQLQDINEVESTDIATLQDMPKTTGIYLPPNSMDQTITKTIVHTSLNSLKEKKDKISIERSALQILNSAVKKEGTKSDDNQNTMNNREESDKVFGSCSCCATSTICSSKLFASY
jgi:cation transport regulator ChaB